MSFFKLAIFKGMNLLQCDASAATFEFFKTLSTPPPVNMLLGCACSVASVPTAEFSHLFNITQVNQR